MRETTVGLPLCFGRRSKDTPGVVDGLCAHGARIDIRNAQGLSPLMVAAGTGKVKVVESLLGLGADVHIRDKRERTALIYAVSGGSEQIVELLLRWHADANVASRHGNSGLFWACYKGHIEIAKTLLAAGAQIECKEFQRPNATLLGGLEQQCRSCGPAYKHGRRHQC